MYITTLYTGDLTEVEKEMVEEHVRDARYNYFAGRWYHSVDAEDRAQMTFDLESYKDDPVYQFYERLLGAIN